LEVWLIGRDDDFIGQILEVLRIKRRTKKGGEKCSIKYIADEQGYGKSTRGRVMN